MVLKFINKNTTVDKETEYNLWWQDIVNGSVWYGSKYGIGYALAKRGAKVKIISNTNDAGYDKQLALEEDFNIDALEASFNEIKNKALASNVEEVKGKVSTNLIKKALSARYIPIVLVNAAMIINYNDRNGLPEFPHWVVVKGYDSNTFFINDPYTGNEISIDEEIFKQAIGFQNDMHMILVNARS